MENFYFPNLHVKYIHDIYFNNDIDLLIILSLTFSYVSGIFCFLKNIWFLYIMSPNHNLKVD